MNDLINLSEKYPNLNITIGLAVLIEFAKFLVCETKIQLEQTISDEKEIEYLTPNRAAELLGVTLSTLWRWKVRNYLEPVSIGGKRRYRSTDIDRILKRGGAK